MTVLQAVLVVEFMSSMLIVILMSNGGVLIDTCAHAVHFNVRLHMCAVFGRLVSSGDNAYAHFIHVYI